MTRKECPWGPAESQDNQQPCGQRNMGFLCFFHVLPSVKHC
jgi:hypothetical protein